MKKTFFAAIMLFGAMLFADVAFFGNGAKPEIVVGKTPPLAVKFAADEMAYFLEKSLGAPVAVKEASV